MSEATFEALILELQHRNHGARVAPCDQIDARLKLLGFRPSEQFVRLLALGSSGGLGPGHGTLFIDSQELSAMIAAARDRGAPASWYPLFDLGDATVMWCDTERCDAPVVLAFEGSFYELEATVARVLRKWLDGEWHYDDLFIYGGVSRTVSFRGRAATLPPRRVLGVRGKRVLRSTGSESS